MKQIRNLIASCVLLVAFTAPAHAGVVIEPYLGMLISGDAGQDDTDDLSGTLYGLRLGYSFLTFSAGVEYMTGSLEVDSDPSSTDVDPGDLGVYVGFDFPVLIRAYFTYFLDSTWGIDSGDFTGGGYKLGIGYTGLPFVSINLEMGDFSFDEFEDNSLSTDFEADFMMLSVSLPLP